MSDLPKGWEETTIQEIVSILGDGLHGTPKYIDDGEYYFINGNNLVNGKIEIKNDTKRTSVQEYNKYKKNLNTRTLLVSINGTLGNVAEYNNEKCFLGKSACYFNILDNVNKEFIKYIILNNQFQKYINKFANGSTIKNVSLKTIREYSFYIPKSLEEQKQIANILSSFDKKIELLKEQKQTLETMAQTIFKEWFVDFNYPNATDEMIDSEMGEIPKGWEIIQINNLFDVRDGTHDSPKQTLNGKYLITSKHILNFKLDMENAYLISEEDFFNINKRSLVEENDILFSMIGTIGLTYLEQSSNINYAIKNVALFKTSQNIEWVYYMYIWLSGEKGQDFIVKHKTGSTQQYISLSSLRNIKIIKPRNEVLIHFNNFARPMFNKIKINTSQIQTLEETRDSLLPKLMSGKIRLKDFDE